MSEVDNDGGKRGRSRRGGCARWGHWRRANDDSLFPGDSREVRNKKINELSKHEVKSVPNVGGRARVIFGGRGEPAGEGTAEVGERLVEGIGNVSHLVRQKGGNGALLCALIDLCAPQVDSPRFGCNCIVPLSFRRTPRNHDPSNCDRRACCKSWNQHIPKLGNGGGGTGRCPGLYPAPESCGHRKGGRLPTKVMSPNHSGAAFCVAAAEGQWAYWVQSTPFTATATVGAGARKAAQEHLLAESPLCCNRGIGGDGSSGSSSFSTLLNKRRPQLKSISPRSPSGRPPQWKGSNFLKVHRGEQ